MKKRSTKERKKFLLSMPDELHLILKIHAATKGESLNNVINEVLLRFLSKSRISEIKNAYIKYGVNDEEY